MKNLLYKRIKVILETFPDTRNSDILLTTTLWENYYPNKVILQESTGRKFVSIEDLYILPREDHIKRLRAKIQNEEREFLPTDLKILVERAKLSREWKDYLGYAKGWSDFYWMSRVQ